MAAEPEIVKQLRNEEQNGDLKKESSNDDISFNNQDFFKLAVDNSLDSFFLIDRKEMRFIDVNRTACESTGYTRQELLNMGPQDIKPEFSKQQLIENFDSVLNSKDRKGVIETIHKRKDGSTFPVEVFLSCLKNKNVIIASVRDITERILAKNKAEENEKSFATIFNSADDAIYIHDLEGNFLEVNDTACRTMGYSKEEFLKMSPKDIDSPRYAKMLDKRISKLKERGQNIFETIHITKAGKEIPVELNTKIIDYHGNQAILSIARDITERKKTELKIRDSEKELRDFFDNANDLIQSVDSDGRFKFVNKKWKEVTGYSDEEIKNLHFTDILKKEYVSHCNKIFNELSKGKSFDNVDVVFKTKEGKEVFVNGNLNSQIVDGKFVSTRGIFRDVSERIKNEEALKESEKKYRSLVERMDDTIYRMTIPEGRYEYFSSSAEEVFGYSREEFINNPRLIKKIIHPDFAGYFKEKWKELLKGKVQKTYEYKIIDSEGNERWIFQSNKAIFDDSGRIKAIESLCRNVTERKQAEEALRVSEEKLSDILNNITDVVWSLSWPDLTHNYISPSLEKLYGRSRQEFIDNPTLFKEVTHPDDQHLTEKAMKQLLEEGEAERECRIIKPDGSIVWVNDRSKIIYDENHQPIKVLGVTRDITERKQTEEEVINQKKYLETILRTTVDGFWIVGKNKKITQVNDAYCRMSGYSKEELQQMTINNIDVKEEFEETDSRIRRIIQNGSEMFESKHRRKDGSVFDVEVSTTFLNIYGGQFICFFRDITERKQAEETLQKSEHRLRSITENVLGAIYRCRFDPKWTMIFLSNHIKTISGYPASDFIDNNVRAFADIIHSDDRSIVEETISQATAKKRHFSMEYRIIDSKGNIRWVFEKGQAFFDDGGNLAYLDGAIFDITEKKKSEEKIKKQIKNTTLLNTVISEGSKAENTQEYFSKTLNLILEKLSYDAGGIYLIDEGKKTASVVCSKNIPEKFLNLIKKVSIDDNPLYKKLFRDGEMIVVEDYMKTHPEHVKISGFNPIISIPIYSNKSIIGAFNLYRSIKCISEKSEVKILQAAVSQIGLVVDRLENNEKLNARLEELKRWKKVTVGRELQMKELKKKIKKLENK